LLQLTTGEVSIVRLNTDIQAIVVVVAKVEEKQVFEMSSTSAQKEDRCHYIDNDLENDKGPDGPFLGSRIGFGDTKKECTET
jgi:hypothetical protein